MSEFKSTTFATGTTVFDYYVNEKRQFTLWAEKVPNFELDTDIPLQVSFKVLGIVLGPLKLCSNSLI